MMELHASIIIVVYCCDCMEWRVVSGGGDHDIKLWDIESGHVTATLSGHTQEVVRSCNKTLLLSYQVTFFYQLCIQCTSYVIASASADSMVRLWNYYGTVSSYMSTK